MRVSRIYRPSTDLPEAERTPASRLVLWGVVFALLLVGVGLFFKYGKRLTPLF